MNRRRLCRTLAITGLLIHPTFGQELRETLQDFDVGARWQYNDWESAQVAAAKSKKPILALFR